MPSKKQKQQKAHKLKLREDAAATQAAKEAAWQADAVDHPLPRYPPAAGFNVISSRWAG